MVDQQKKLIEVKDVWKAYGPHQVLKGLTLDIFEGETLVILGRSGVGKSVMLRQLLGLERPDKGVVAIKGKDINRMSQLERVGWLRKMGMLFQSSALFDSMTVGENTAFYLTQHKDEITGKWTPKEEIKERVAEALNDVGLAGTENKMPSDLSGGMRRRAALARLIIYRPTLLLYDEPTTGLDPMTAMQINELIVATQVKLKATSIVVTHDLASATHVGDRLAFHTEGKIQHIGPKATFFATDDPLIRSFLDNATIEPEYLPPDYLQNRSHHD